MATLDGSALDTLHWLGRNLREYNGKRLMPRTGAIAMVMVGDASRTAVGGFCTHRALLEGITGVSLDDAGWQAMIAAWTDRQLEVGLVTVVDLTPEEQAAAKTEALSSTWRELRAMLTMLEVAEVNCPEVVRHARVQYLTDSMSAKHAANGQKGNRALQQLVRDIWLLCHRLDLQLEVEWRPRGEELQQLADALSKVQDGSQWALNQQVYTSEVLALLHRACPGVVDFTVDLFADPSNAKVAAFFSRFYAPGTSGVLGVNAFAHPWAWRRRAGGPPQRHMCYCNPPFDKMMEVVGKIIRERADVLLVFPAWPRPYHCLLRRMQTAGWAAQQGLHAPPVREVVQLPNRTDLFEAGPRVPGRQRDQQRWQCAKYRVCVAAIVWDEKDHHLALEATDQGIGLTSWGTGRMALRP